MPDNERCRLSGEKQKKRLSLPQRNRQEARPAFRQPRFSGLTATGIQKMPPSRDSGIDSETLQERLVPDNVHSGELVFGEQVIQIITGFDDSGFGFFPYRIAGNGLGFTVQKYFRAFTQIGDPDIVHVFVFRKRQPRRVGRELKHSRTNCWAYFPFGYCISPLPPVRKRRTKSCLPGQT